MRRFIAIAGLLFASLTHATDYAVEQGQGGINVFSFGLSNATLMKGSPFIPNNPLSGPEGPVLAPDAVTISTGHNFVYAVYTDSPLTGTLVVGYSITSAGLVQQWHTNIQIGAGGTNGSRIAYIVNEGNYLFVYYYPPAGPYELSVAMLATNGKLLFQNVGSSNQATGEVTQFVTIKADPAGSYFYVCSNVENYAMNSGYALMSVYTISKATHLYDVVNQDLINSECFP